MSRFLIFSLCLLSCLFALVVLKKEIVQLEPESFFPLLKESKLSIIIFTSSHVACEVCAEIVPFYDSFVSFGEQKNVSLVGFVDCNLHWELCSSVVGFLPTLVVFHKLLPYRDYTGSLKNVNNVLTWLSKIVTPVAKLKSKDELSQFLHFLPPSPVPSSKADVLPHSRTSPVVFIVKYYGDVGMNLKRLEDAIHSDVLFDELYVAFLDEGTVEFPVIENDAKNNSLISLTLYNSDHPFDINNDRKPLICDNCFNETTGDLDLLNLRFWIVLNAYPPFFPSNSDSVSRLISSGMPVVNVYFYPSASSGQLDIIEKIANHTRVIQQESPSRNSFSNNTNNYGSNASIHQWGIISFSYEIL